MLSTLRRLAERIAARIGVEPGNFIGVCLAIVSGLFLMANGAVGKHLGAELHPFVITFFRSVFIVAAMVPLFARHGLACLRPTRLPLHLVNAVIATAAVLLWFWALPRVPLDMVASIGFTSQLYAIVGAILFLGERSRAWRWAALGVGFIGAMIIVRPGFVEMTPGVIAVVATAVLFSTNRLMIKAIATFDNPETCVFWQAVFGIFMTLPFAIWAWQTPAAAQFPWLIAVAGLTLASHYTMAWALRLADVGAVEPTTFMRLIWGALLGLAFFGEVPNLYTVAGGIVVLGSILYIARRERREGKERKPASVP